MTSPRRPVRLRGPEDLIALVPVILGFEPEESIVMVGTGGEGTFSARLDLPAPPDLAGCSADLLAPALKHAGGRVLFVLYTADGRLARRAARRLCDDFTMAGIHVEHLLRVHDGRWFAPCGGSDVPDDGVPFDVSAHPIRLQAIVDGVVTAPSRAALKARLDTDPEASHRVALALPAAVPLDGAAMVALAGARDDGREPITDAEVAAVLTGLLDDRAVAAACRLLDRASAARQLRFWTEVVRRAPSWLLAEGGAMLAFVAWLAGDGAIAWCAVDRSRERGGHPLAELVERLLDAAVAPSQWTGDLWAIPDEAGG